MSNTLDQSEHLEKLGESPYMLSIRQAVADQLRSVTTAERPSRPVITVELDESDTESEDQWPDDASPDLIAAVGMDILRQCEPRGEHIIWLGRTNGTGQASPQHGIVDGDLAKSEGTSVAHRIVWRRSYGPIPDRSQIKHTCEFSLCMRPDHLELNRLPVAYQVEVIRMQPVKVVIDTTAIGFDEAVAYAHSLPNVLRILGIREKDSH